MTKAIKRIFSSLRFIQRSPELEAYPVPFSNTHRNCDAKEKTSFLWRIRDLAGSRHARCEHVFTNGYGNVAIETLSRRGNSPVDSELRGISDGLKIATDPEPDSRKGQCVCGFTVCPVLNRGDSLNHEAFSHHGAVFGASPTAAGTLFLRGFSTGARLRVCPALSWAESGTCSGSSIRHTIFRTDDGVAEAAA